MEFGFGAAGNGVAGDRWSEANHWAASGSGKY